MSLGVRSRVPAQLNAIFGSCLSQTDCRSLTRMQRLIDRVLNGQPRIAPASTFLHRSLQPRISSSVMSQLEWRDKSVLTLFEYLRRRAFEAVIDGTQDALEFLESQKNFDQSDPEKNTIEHRSGTAFVAGPDPPSQRGSIRKRPATKDDQPLPPPRRRGRPRKNEAKK